MKNRNSAAALLLFCLFAVLPCARSHPYASGITHSGTTVSWVLNEPATDVVLSFDNGSVSFDLGSAPVVGTNTFDLTSHTNFSISVYKIGSNAITQISSNANVNNSFGGPRGVAVNTNARAGNFGRIYVANANPLSAHGRSTTKGIYAMDAASGDCLGLGNTAALSGMLLGTGTGNTKYSPFKLGLGPDDALYVGDSDNSTIGGVWRIDANLLGAASIFNLANPSTLNTITSGTNFGRVIGTPNVTGSLSGGNLVLTLTAWDLNLINPPGTHPPTAASYQNIYQYNIGAGPLPWASFPSIVTNPISIGTVNTVSMDVQVAPDGKYFVTAYRLRGNDGATNVCVLSSDGKSVLWDSRSQCASYFGDAVNDHLSLADTSISVSPDDKYVLIQGSTNSTFLLMALTNGVPDISTLTTNNPSADTAGTMCWASTWDAADNIYVTSGGSDYLRVFSLGLTTTCITSNDVSFTNGSFRMFSVSGAAPTIVTQPTNQSAQCGGAASFSVTASGASLGYQWFVFGGGANGAVPGATNAVLSLGGVSLAQSGSSYHVVVSNLINSATSQVAVLTVVDTTPPVVTVLGNLTTNITQGSVYTDAGATAVDTCGGNLSVHTSGTVNTSVGGTYVLTYSATDPSGNSATNSRTVIVNSTNAPPSILQQPANLTAACGGTAIFTASVSGTPPISYQWLHASVALQDNATTAGSKSASLTLSSVNPALSGTSYTLAITNNFGATNTQAAVLTVVDTNKPILVLAGSAAMNVPIGGPFVDPGATASDPCAGSLSVSVSGSVNTSSNGTYVLTYIATGPGGVSATNTRSVNVYNSQLASIWTMYPGSPVGSGASGDGQRSDDIYFVSATTGFASRDTKIYKTLDGGNTWNVIYTSPTNAHFRSLGFLTPTHGFAGNLGVGSYDPAVVDTNVLYETKDAGATWHVFQGLSQQGMKGFCAMHVYDSNTIYGAGRVRGPAFFVKSTDGGTNFSLVNLTAAGVMNGIMDVYFNDPTNGWVVGMDMNNYSANCSPAYHGCIARTTDGGATWTPVVVTTLGCCYFWKMAWPNRQVGYVSLQQNGTIGSIIYYKTTDGGNTWVPNNIPLSSADGCAFYLQGIGFSDTNTGWMGGASCSAYSDSFVQTTDGGATWSPIGYFDTTHMNRLRFTSTNWGYACGFGLHQYTPPLAITNQPSGKLVSGGATVQFQPGVFTLSAASYQWQLNGAAIPGATGSTFILTNASRANEGSYTVVVSNSYGAVISSNAMLQVAVPQLLTGPRALPGGGVQVSFGDADGTPLTSNDFINLELDASSNLILWQPLHLPFSLSNGLIQVNDPTNYPSRFYRVVEH